TSDERGGVLRKSPDGRFRFSEPVFRSYAQVLLTDRQHSPLSTQMYTIISSGMAEWVASTWTSGPAFTLGSASWSLDTNLFTTDAKTNAQMAYTSVDSPSRDFDQRVQQQGTATDGPVPGREQPNERA